MAVFSTLDFLSDVPEVFLLVILAIGAICVFKFALKTLNVLYEVLLRPGVNIKSYGEWAVITGATDGIGKAYAFELAKKGLKICLISRTESKLQDVQNEITSKYNVEVRIVVCDYSNFDEVAQSRVASEISGLDIAILINNVGVSYPFTQYFSELSNQDVKNLVEMNVNSTTWMTRMVLPGMETKKKGLIVNLSSAASQQPSPLLAQYCAAKAYVEKFSASLDAELKGKGIRVQCQVPFYVVSKLAKIKKASLMVPSPKSYVQKALQYIGKDPVVSPWWPHRLQGWVLNDVLPEFLREKIIMSSHLSIRKRGMRKLELAKNQKKD